VILVTGATGNVGRDIVKLLLAGGLNAAGVTRNRADAKLPPAGGRGRQRALFNSY
jgi:uncharacterized protein YbjT (DUF2867 family)